MERVFLRQQAPEFWSIFKESQRFQISNRWS